MPFISSTKWLMSLDFNQLQMCLRLFSHFWGRFILEYWGDLTKIMQIMEIVCCCFALFHSIWFLFHFLFCLDLRVFHNCKIDFKLRLRLEQREHWREIGAGGNTGQNWGRSSSLGFVSLGSQTLKLKKYETKIKKLKLNKKKTKEERS